MFRNSEWRHDTAKYPTYPLQNLLHINLGTGKLPRRKTAQFNTTFSYTVAHISLVLQIHALWTKGLLHIDINELKGKGHPRTGQEDPKGEQMYSSTLPSTSALDGGVGGQRHDPAALPPGKTRYPLYSRLGGNHGRSGRGRKISPPTGNRSPDRPARSESLYRLSYPGPHDINELLELNTRVVYVDGYEQTHICRNYVS